MPSSILFRHPVAECFFPSYTLFVTPKLLSAFTGLYSCSTNKSLTESINWHNLANHQVRSNSPNITWFGCPSKRSLFFTTCYFFLKVPRTPETPCCSSSNHLHLDKNLPVLSVYLVKLLCNTIKWYELLTTQLTIQSYSAFHLPSNTICLHLFLLPRFL